MKRVSDEHKAAVKQLYRDRQRKQHKYDRDVAAYAKLSYDGQKLLDVCSYCGATNAYRHKHRTGMCVECGKLYERWRKAQRQGVQSELRLLKPVLLQRRDEVLRKDKAAATKSANYYKRVEQTEVQDMAIVTHKVCKQCGRDLPIEEFRKYVPRGNGVYKTTQGHHTICKNCEKISQRATHALNKGDEAAIVMLREHYRLLQERGFEPATAPARKLLGVDKDDAPKRRSDLADLLNISQGAVDPDESELDKHCRLVRQRGYASFEEADAAHRRLTAELQHTMPDVYEEINNLMDDWYMEE